MAGPTSLSSDSCSIRFQYAATAYQDQRNSLEDNRVTQFSHMDITNDVSGGRVGLDLLVDAEHRTCLLVSKEQDT
jgi:hypothetical protein